MKSYFEVQNLKELCELMGLPPSEAARLRIRVDLAKAIRKVIEQNGLTHAIASEKADVGRTVITAIANGNLNNISTDRLIDVAHALGLKIQLKVA
jgi:predicted XRE-type DNA-binding protein